MNPSYRDRDIGIIFGYIGFNILLYFALYYVARVFKWKNIKTKKRDSKQDKEVKIPANEPVSKDIKQ